MRKQFHNGIHLFSAVVVGLAIVAAMYYFVLWPRFEKEAWLADAEDTDLAQAKVLTYACQIYKAEKGDWPPNLEALTQPKTNGGPPYIDPSALVPKSIPNGQFGYDPSGRHNKGIKPDIWIDGPHGQIGNWMHRL